ncbi:RagB/SusD family nutrient uptake outer membrane protein [Fulvivirga aurantia]|uniref:RagB/SusD family nutrient uptake outer membrane protein n=1 Tax=Fulvivirga aurantia TaxID=2529383 RepID=UPI00162547DC|nr:RagB/SusD family nutrient uptake outer membrane protein [Fulvivirga aurantia]
MKKSFIYILSAALIFTAFSCDEQLELEEENVLLPEEALVDAEDYEQLLNSAYDVLRGSNGRFLGGQSQIFSDLLAREIDEAGLTGDYEEIYRRNTGFFNGSVSGYYQEPYITTFRANVLLEEIEGVSGVTQSDIDRIKGEAFFLRGISHMDVLLKFAQPYGFTSDNSHPGISIKTEASQEVVLRSTFQESYDQVESDLLQAATLLANGNDRGFGFADEYAAKAYLARLYFYSNLYDQAYEMANDVIENGDASLDSDLMVRFSQGQSDEGVFVMPSLNNQDHRGVGFTNNYRSDVNDPNLKIDSDVYELVASNSDDLRYAWFIVEEEDTADEEIFITKYNGLDYFDMPLIHITELKLIRAESAAILNENLNVAIQDINDIRERAYGSADENLEATASSNSIIEAARLERRIEMVTEGAYLHDVKRIGVLEQSQSVTVGGATWDCNGLLLEFPALETVEGYEGNEPNGC